MTLVNPDTCGAGRHEQCDGSPCECPCGHAGTPSLRQAINEVLLSGGTVLLGRSVLCDWCDADMTNDPRSGGFLFQSKAVCPDCAPEGEARIKGYGEERFIRGRCPEGVSFADWVRGMRGPGAAVRMVRWEA